MKGEFVKTKVLQIGCDNFGKGGRSVIIYNLTEFLSNQYKIDFLATSNSFDQTYFDKIRARDGEILVYQSKCINKILGEIFRFLKISQMIKKGQYDIVHINADDAWEAYKSFIIAKSAGVNKIIVHAHTSKDNITISFLKKIILKFSKRRLQSKNVDKLACTIEASEYMFGNSQDVTIIENGIDLTKYTYSESTRAKVREELGVKSDATLVYGTVGRISHQKNPLFILDFIQSLSLMNEEFIFVWIGSGDMKRIVLEKAKQLGIESQIRFLGDRSDVNNIMQAFDVFILPSFYEGFGIVNVEAQASGLECIVSDTIPEIVKVNSNFHFLPLSIGVDGWVNFITNQSHTRERLKNFNSFSEKGFDISQSAEKLREVYRSIINGK